MEMGSENSCCFGVARCGNLWQMQVHLTRHNEIELKKMAKEHGRSVAWCANSEIASARAMRYMASRRIKVAKNRSKLPVIEP